MNLKVNERKPSTLEQVESWLEIASQMGYRVRYDDFGAGGGGVCQFGGQKWIFVDISLSAWEQLSLLEQALPKDPIYSSVKQTVSSTVQRAA